MVLWYIRLLLLLCTALFSHCDQSVHDTSVRTNTSLSQQVYDYVWLAVCKEALVSKQPGMKIQHSYSSSQSMAVGCACVFYFFALFLYRKCVQPKRKRGRYTLQDESTLDIQYCTTASQVFLQSRSKNNHKK